MIDPNKPPSGANVKQAKLDVLSEPYPQVVAGTPTSYGFDDATRRVHARLFHQGADREENARCPKHKCKHSRSKFRQTQIFLGQDRDPGGYALSVKAAALRRSARRACSG